MSTAVVQHRVYLVRHAEKAEPAQRDPPLSAAGMARAEQLGLTLADAGIASIITTQFRRTRATAAPLAQRLGLAPEAIGLTQESLDLQMQKVARVVHSRLKNGSVLVVGHSNTIPALILALGGPQIAQICESEFSHLFTLAWGDETGRTTLARSSYGAVEDPAGNPCP